MRIGRPSWGRSRPSQGGAASAAQAGGLGKGDETAWRSAWCGTTATTNAHQASRVALVVVTALAAAGGASAALPGQSASASLSSAVPKTRPVGVTLQLHYAMQCGNPGIGPVKITFPAQMHLPATIARAAVLVDGKAAPSVSRTGHVLAVGLPVPGHGITCMSITIGTLTLEFTRAAGLGNPQAAGTYTLAIRKGTLSFSASFSLRG